MKTNVTRRVVDKARQRRKTLTMVVVAAALQPETDRRELNSAVRLLNAIRAWRSCASARNSIVAVTAFGNKKIQNNPLAVDLFVCDTHVLDHPPIFCKLIACHDTQFLWRASAHRKT